MAEVEIPLVPEAEAGITSFNDVVEKIPYNPSTDEGKGFLPILGRVSGHLLYLVGRYSDVKKAKPSKDEAKEELEGALNHWNFLVIDKSLSKKSTEEISILDESLRLAFEQIDGWEEKDSILNLTKLSNRFVQYLANLDREVLGIRESDAGLNL